MILIILQILFSHHYVNEQIANDEIKFCYHDNNIFYVDRFIQKKNNSFIISELSQTNLNHHKVKLDDIEFSSNIQDIKIDPNYIYLLSDDSVILINRVNFRIDKQFFTKQIYDELHLENNKIILIKNSITFNGNEENHFSYFSIINLNSDTIEEHKLNSLNGIVTTLFTPRDLIAFNNGLIYQIEPQGKYIYVTNIYNYACDTFNINLNLNTENFDLTYNDKLAVQNNIYNLREFIHNNTFIFKFEAYNNLLYAISNNYNLSNIFNLYIIDSDFNVIDTLEINKNTMHKNANYDNLALTNQIQISGSKVIDLQTLPIELKTSISLKKLIKEVNNYYKENTLSYNFITYELPINYIKPTIDADGNNNNSNLSNNTVLVFINDIACKKCIDDLSIALYNLKNEGIIPNIYLILELDDSFISRLESIKYFTKYFDKKDILFLANSDNSYYKQENIKQTPSLMIFSNNTNYYLDYEKIDWNQISTNYLKKLLRLP